MENIEKEKPKGVLFGVLAYMSDDEYLGFLNQIKVGSEAEIVLVVNTALRYAQSKGVFSLEESEIILNTLKVFSQENTNDGEVEDTESN